MRFAHRDHPGRGVRLAYCTNLHPAEDLDGVLDGLRSITLPLAERLSDVRGNWGFGVGLWLSGPLALDLGAPMGRHERDRLVGFLAEHDLDAFTFNAFPYGGFHRDGLKENVFRPTWKSPERLAYTTAVADIALEARAARASTQRSRDHISISTHAGMFGAAVEGPDDLDAIADNYALCALYLSRMEGEGRGRVVLAIEPEPRSSANDTRELAAILERTRVRAEQVLGRGLASLRDTTEAIVRRHVGTCLDACHAAVEFELEHEAFERATPAGTPLGKLQFSSALALPNPATDQAGREHLFGMAEPVFLHQVTGRNEGAFVRATDLPELADRWGSGADDWRACDEWRCHFHVPVDLGDLGPSAGGLTTTRAQADCLLDVALDQPDRWGTYDLHVEIETYTWDILPHEARGPGDLVDGLEREYRHVLARLAARGWEPE